MHLLHHAAMQGDDKQVRALVDANVDINALDDTGRTVITRAVVGEKYAQSVFSPSDSAYTLVWGSSWQKIDVSDATFMSASLLNILRILLRHPGISLFMLNAPQHAMNGVTPLGMAVQVLVEDNVGTVSGIV
jgi:ankyrin repeat protein